MYFRLEITVVSVDVIVSLCGSGVWLITTAHVSLR